MARMPLRVARVMVKPSSVASGGSAPSKMKIVLLDCREHSPTFGATQVIVAGDGNDVFVKIPEGVAHGYRPLTNPCALLYIVTKTFDLVDPDEFRIPFDHPAVRDLWEVPNG